MRLREVRSNHHETYIERLDTMTIEDLIIRIEERSIVLFSSGAHPDLPAIQDVHGANHMGYGVFTADLPGGDATFCGGGSMNNIKKPDDSWWFSWTTLDGPGAASFPYDREKVIAALRSLDAESLAKK